MKKLYYKFKLLRLIKEHDVLGRRLNRINYMVYPIGDISRIKHHTQYYDEYVRVCERLYEIFIEEANIMLHLGEYERYKEQCNNIKLFEPLIWDVKATA